MTVQGYNLFICCARHASFKIKYCYTISLRMNVITINYVTQKKRLKNGLLFNYFFNEKQITQSCLNTEEE